MPPAAPKQRVNRIALARFEQWALPRLARRLPAGVTPDMLTALGLVSAVAIAAAYALTWYGLGWLWLASAAWVVHWFADSLDGTLARVRRIPRERYGFYVDHQSDAISVLLIFSGLGFSPLMPLPVALFLLVGYLLMMILVNVVALTRDVYKISFGRVGPTEARLGMIAVNTVVFFTGNPVLEFGLVSTTLFGIIGVIGAAALLASYAIFSAIERAKLSRLDPTPEPGPAETPPAAESRQEGTTTAQ
jgi:archaetidylinositol phosphate synthase